MIQDTKLNIIRWLDSLKNYREFKPQKPPKFSKNIYSLFFLLFKYLIFKDICVSSFHALIHKYNINLYYNIIECRFYYLFYLIIIRNKLYDFKIFFDKSVPDYFSRNFIKSYKYIFFFNRYIFIYVYLLKYLNFFLIAYSKYNYHLNRNIYHNLFFFKEFKLKVDYNSFFFYRKYIYFFHLAKYNEYLSNHKMLWKYPKLKYLLHIFFCTLKKSERKFRKNTLLHFFYIYKLNQYKSIFLDKHNLNLKYSRFNTNNNIILIRSLNLNFLSIYKLDNPFFYLKSCNLNLLKLLDLISNNFYYKLINISFILLSIYIAHASYKVYHFYIARYKQIRRLKCRHIIASHWKFNLLKFKFLPQIFKIFYKILIQDTCRQPNIINYGFLSYYFLENNNYVKIFVRKNILLYRITNILIIEYISLLFDHWHRDLNREAHKFKGFDQPDILKMWQINITKTLRKKIDKSIAPIYSNINNPNSNSIHSFDNNTLPYDPFQINYIFLYLWKLIFRWSILIFIDILNITRNTNGFLKIFSNYKYSFEFISWEILNSNNNTYIFNKYFLKFNYLLKYIKIENIITIFLSKYTNSILEYIINYPKDYFINISFIYYFLRDYYFLILSKKNKLNNIKSILLNKKSIINNFNLFYYRFFYWQLQSFLGLQRFWLFYHKHQTYYIEYYFYF